MTGGEESPRAGAAGVADRLLAWRPPRPRRPSRVDLAFGGGLLVVLGLFFAGAWQRRWIADDGLIVLRTVRNLAAGNGPVFNAGERVESNTSTLWTYLIWVTQEVLGIRLELVALTIALVLSLGAVAAAMLGTRRLYAGHGRAGDGDDSGSRSSGGAPLLIPFGVLVYIVVPPARDFATSGLETGLVICWLGVLWWAMQRWAHGDAREYRWGLPGVATGATAFLAGLGPLVRPELAMVAAPVLLLMVLARQTWWHRLWLVAIAAVVPVVYQVWRMSYYALPVPITAVAKDAGGAKWNKGFAYLQDLIEPYGLLLPAVVVLLTGAVVGWATWRSRAGSVEEPAGETTTGATSADRPTLAERVRALPDRARTPGAVTASFVAVGLLMLVYEIRVGGDFMHGRVLLPALFLLLLPVAVVPIPVGAAGDAREARVRRVLVPVVGVAWLVVVGWALSLQMHDQPFADRPEEITTAGIVDERQFYVQHTGHRHPLLADDYLDFPRMRALVREVSENRTGAVFLPKPGVQDRWEVLSYDHPLPGLQPYELPADPLHTVVFLNLGMTSMNLPLDVPIYDTVGLSAPLSAHTERLEDGRIGHDKSLPYDWVLAQTGVIEDRDNLPEWMDEDWFLQARVAITCPATQALMDSYRGPLTPSRRVSNLMNAFSYSEYRIDRVPAHEVERCGLPMPEKVEKDDRPR